MSSSSSSGSELRIPSVSLSLSSVPPGVSVAASGGSNGGVQVVSSSSASSCSPGALSLRGPRPCGGAGVGGGVHLLPVSSHHPFYKPVTITPAPSRLLSLGGSLSFSPGSSSGGLRGPSGPLRPPKGPLGPRTISLPYAPSPLPSATPASSLPVARVVPQPCLGATTMTLLPPGAPSRNEENRPPAVSVTPVLPVRGGSLQQLPTSEAKMIPLKGTSLTGCALPPTSRPGILRRRETESSTASIILSSTTTTTGGGDIPSVHHPPPPSSLPLEEESLSSGSTTLSATSSPGLGVPPANNSSSGGEDAAALSQQQQPTVHSSSPRKKPRKQSFGKSLSTPTTSCGGDGSPQASYILSTHSSNIKSSPVTTSTNKCTSSSRLLSNRGSPWPSRHNHFLRYSDVRVRPDRRPTVGELASHPWVSQQVEGWKLYHLSSQMEDVGSCEEELSANLLELQRRLLSSAHAEVNLSGVLESIKANLQRSRILRDQVGESRDSLLSIFEHKPRVLGIINKYVRQSPNGGGGKSSASKRGGEVS